MKHDEILKAAHYNNHPSGVEAKELLRHFNFCLGNALKYLWRHEDKEAPLKDLRKAVFYLREELADQGRPLHASILPGTMPSVLEVMSRLEKSRCYTHGRLDPASVDNTFIGWVAYEFLCAYNETQKSGCPLWRPWVESVLHAVESQVFVLERKAKK